MILTLIKIISNRKMILIKTNISQIKINISQINTMITKTMVHLNMIIITDRSMTINSTSSNKTKACITDPVETRNIKTTTCAEVEIEDVEVVIIRIGMAQIEIITTIMIEVKEEVMETVAEIKAIGTIGVAEIIETTIRVGIVIKAPSETSKIIIVIIIIRMAWIKAISRFIREEIEAAEVDMMVIKSNFLTITISTEWVICKIKTDIIKIITVKININRVLIQMLLNIIMDPLILIQETQSSLLTIQTTNKMETTHKHNDVKIKNK